MNDVTKIKPQSKFRGHALAERMLLVKAKEGRLSNTIIDKSLTQDILDQSGCAPGAATGRKELFAPADISPVSTLYNQGRNITKEMTLPWKEGGWNGIPTGNYSEYLAKKEAKYRELDTAANVFAMNIDSIIEKQRARLGSLFNRDDYPSAQQFRDAWHHDIETEAVPSTDIRSQVDDEQRADIQRQIEKRLSDRFSVVWQEGAERLAKGVAHVSKILNSDGANGRKSPVNATLIENLRVQVNVARELAIACDDTDLKKLAEEVERKLLQVPAEELAANPGIKGQVGKDAQHLATRSAREVQAVDARVQDMVTEFEGY